MLILEDLSAEIPDTNSYHWDLKSLSEDDGKNVLMYGYNSSNNKDFHQQCEEYTKVFFNNWAPCEFAQAKDHFGAAATEYDHRFDIVYSICPYSNKWLNQLSLGREYRNIFYPFNKNLIPEKKEKKYDVIYHGGIHGKEHIECLETMLPFNYQYITMTKHINEMTHKSLGVATKIDLSFERKLEVIAESKISVCYNIVHALSDTLKDSFLSQPAAHLNEAFSAMSRAHGETLPQFKTRMHEAAFCRTLNLVYKDEWNVAEEYYTPNEDFLYFTNKKDLERKIRDISNDFENYQSLIDNAYNKSLNYTTDNFVGKIRRELEEK
jgi:hypothetical protein